MENENNAENIFAIGKSTVNSPTLLRKLAITHFLATANIYKD